MVLLMEQETLNPKWRQIKCSGGPLPYMSVKWPVREGERVPIRDHTGGAALLGEYVLRQDVYQWEARK